MNVPDQVEISFGLPEECRHQAAEIYFEAFRRKFEPIMVSQQHSVAILKEAFESDLVIVALHRDQLVGVAGLQVDGRSSINARPSIFIHQFGWLRGLFKFVLFLLLAQSQSEGELLLDGIAVHSSYTMHSEVKSYT